MFSVQAELHNRIENVGLINFLFRNTHAVQESYREYASCHLKFRFRQIRQPQFPSDGRNPGIAILRDLHQFHHVGEHRIPCFRSALSKLFNRTASIQPAFADDHHAVSVNLNAHRSVFRQNAVITMNQRVKDRFPDSDDRVFILVRPFSILADNRFRAHILTNSTASSSISEMLPVIRLLSRNRAPS